MDIAIVYERIGKAHKALVDEVLGAEAAGLDTSGPGVGEVLTAEALATLAGEVSGLRAEVAGLRGRVGSLEAKKSKAPKATE
jgi:hypothetical protein